MSDEIEDNALMSIEMTAEEWHEFTEAILWCRRTVGESKWNSMPSRQLASTKVLATLLFEMIDNHMREKDADN